MCPFNTVTEPNFLRYDNACALSSVPQPHSGYTDHKGMCANTTMGVLYCKGFTSSSNHSSCSWPSVPRSEEHTSELQSRLHLVCRLLLEKKKQTHITAVAKATII